MAQIMHMGPGRSVGSHARGGHGLAEGEGETAVDDRRAGQGHEQPWRSRLPAVPVAPVGGERLGGGSRHGHVAALAELGVAHLDDGLVPVQVAAVEAEGLTDPQAGDSEQHDQAGQRLGPEGEWRRGPCGTHHRGHVLVGEQVRDPAAGPVRD